MRKGTQHDTCNDGHILLLTFSRRDFAASTMLAPGTITSTVAAEASVARSHELGSCRAQNKDRGETEVEGGLRAYEQCERPAERGG
jgi:hypothetical protein